MQVFTKDFLDYPEEAICNELEKKGFFCFERALTQEFIDAIFDSVESNRFGINNNWIKGIYTERQYYLTHMLAVSREFYQYVTHEKVLSISKKVLGDRIRLKAMRYYETMGGHRMQWHTDNKTDKGVVHIPGLIFISYLVDVNDGEFQYVSNSHNWSGTRAYSDYSEHEIESKFKNQVVSFKKPMGSIIIYDTYGVHRARPTQDKNHVRKSLFFQVDSDISSAEPIILNPAFCENLTDESKEYLGFGMEAHKQIFPNSRFKDHPITTSICREVFGWLGYRLTKNVIKAVPGSLKHRIKETIK